MPSEPLVTLMILRAMKELSTAEQGERVGVELSVFRGPAGGGGYLIHPRDIDDALAEMEAADAE